MAFLAAQKANECHYLFYSFIHLWFDVSSTSLSTSPSSSSDDMPRFCRRDEWTGQKWGEVLGPGKGNIIIKGYVGNGLRSRVNGIGPQGENK